MKTNEPFEDEKKMTHQLADAEKNNPDNLVEKDTPDKKITEQPEPTKSVEGSNPDMDGENLDNTKEVVSQKEKLMVQHPKEETTKGMQQPDKPAEKPTENTSENMENAANPYKKSDEQPKTSEETKDGDSHTKASEKESSENADRSTEEDDNLDEDGDSSIKAETIEEIVRELKKLSESDFPKRTDVNVLKELFYCALRNETEQQKAAFIADGGDELDFVVQEAELYIEGKELFKIIKEKRAAVLAKEEAERESTLLKKRAIIDKITELIDNQGIGDFNKVYQEFRSLQQEWNKLGQVPKAQSNSVWETYQRQVEKFYDLVRINNEFREYDFRKNLELKTELCEIAERLDEEPDIVSAFHQLQKLHQEWREIGPVSRKDREPIWERFKEASSVINRKYHAHFEKLREGETENLQLKQELCEKLEAIDYKNIKTLKDWNKQLKQVLAIQEEWRKIGFVPRKWNKKIYERYRAACGLFFKNKKEFHRSNREQMDKNLIKKLELCERAEAMKDSQDWKKTTEDMINIQQEWKAIGPVPRKHTDATWKRFISACDHFFEQKKINTSTQYDKEVKNLEEKRTIIEKINNIDTSVNANESLKLLRALVEEWYQIGFVPFKEKDEIYEQFRAAADAQFDRLNIDKEERHLEDFKSNLASLSSSDSGRSQLLRERDKLMRQYDRMKAELQTYENNLGFLSISSKKGNSLLDDMNQKVKKIKSQLELIVKKIEVIDKQL